MAVYVSMTKFLNNLIAKNGIVIVVASATHSGLQGTAVSRYAFFIN